MKQCASRHLSAHTLHAVCRAFAIEPERITRQWSGKNPTYHVQAPDQALFLKCHSGEIRRVSAVVEKLVEMRTHGFQSFPEFHLSREEGAVVEWEAQAWTATAWVTTSPDGDYPPNFTQRLAGILGQFHRVGMSLWPEPAPAVGNWGAGVKRVCSFVKALTRADLPRHVPAVLVQGLDRYREEADTLIRYLEVHEEALCRMQQHAAGLIHGDISPTNTLITPSGSIFLTDWDGCRPDLRIATDLAQFFWRVLWPTRNVRAAMSRYLSECPLSTDEAVLLPVFTSSLHLFAHCLRAALRGLSGEDCALLELLAPEQEEAVIRAPWELAEWVLGQP